MNKIEVLYDELPQEIARTGEVYAKAQSDYDYLDKQREVLLAKIMNDLKDVKSESERKRIALGHEVYEIHMDGLKEARYQSLKAKAEYESVKARYELARSANARKIAEMKLQ